MPKVSVCVLTFANYPRLAREVLESIRAKFPRPEYELIVGANAVGDETAHYLEHLQNAGEIDHLVSSPTNLSKCPMMREMFRKVATEFIWWFDDDSYVVDDGAFERWMTAAAEAPASTVMWGQMAWCDRAAAFDPDLADAVGFVRSAPWYRGLPPPAWKPGGKGQFNFAGRGTGDGRWVFLLGGSWLIRTATIRALDWPDRRLLRNGDDVFLGEAIRQHGWTIADLDNNGVAINTEARRGVAAPKASACLDKMALAPPPL